MGAQTARVEAWRPPDALLAIGYKQCDPDLSLVWFVQIRFGRRKRNNL